MRVRDVMVGEVWLCAGQSNMMMPLSQADDAEREIAAAEDRHLRCFDVDRRLAADCMEPTGCWRLSSPQAAGGFSAVAYHLGRRLREELDVPVGLVHASWGGTALESWMSEQALRQASPIDPAEALRAYRSGQEHEPVELHIDPGVAEGACMWATPACGDTGWPQMPLPDFWAEHGLDCNGAVWFRRTVDVPLSWAGREVTAHLGPIHDQDRVYFDGELIGSTRDDESDTHRIERVYGLPAGRVTPGPHLLAVRVFSRGYHGGFRAKPHAFHLTCPEAEPRTLPLAGPWRYAVEQALPVVSHPRRVPPTMIFHGMVAGLLDYPFAGVAWYQGESNADFPDAYRKLLPAMIQDWRKRTRLEMLPFAVVQLPEFGSEPNDRFRTPWYELAEVQAQVAAELPNVFLVRTRGCGDPNDVHPTAKRPVGERIASAVLRGVYESDAHSLTYFLTGS